MDLCALHAPPRKAVFVSPDHSSEALPLRPYQRKAIHEVHSHLKLHRSTLVVMATGTGKTRVAKDLIREEISKGGKALFLVNTDELAEQSVQTLISDPGRIMVDLEKAKSRATRSVGCVVASVQTLSKVTRLERFPPDHFSLIIIDEAHMSVSATCKIIFGHFHQAKIVGLTATPDRTDGACLSSIFSSIAFDYDIAPAIEDGWLVPLRQRIAYIEGLDYSKIRIQAAKMREGDINAVVNNANMIAMMAEHAVREAGNRPSLIFTLNVAHAMAFTERLVLEGHSAAYVDGSDITSSQRKKIIRDYKAGKIQFLCNCQVLTTGFDAPETSCIIYARPLTSRSLYAQIAGRSTRPICSDALSQHQDDAPEVRRGDIAASLKPDSLLVDFCGNAGKHQLIRAAHIFDHKADLETISIAEVIAHESGSTISDALDQAKKEMAKTSISMLRERVRNIKPSDFKVAVYEKDAISYGAAPLDPFGCIETPRSHILDNTRAVRACRVLGIQLATDGETPSEAALTALSRLGVDDGVVLSKSCAAELLVELERRRVARLATIRQVLCLVERGETPAENALRMSFERAHAGVTELSEHGWSRPRSWGTPKCSVTIQVSAE